MHYRKEEKHISPQYNHGEFASSDTFVALRKCTIIQLDMLDQCSNTECAHLKVLTSLSHVAQESLTSEILTSYQFGVYLI